MKNFITTDTNLYKLFPVGEHYGIITWCNRLIFEPRCIRKPNVLALEKYGYTFVHLEEGLNIINNQGDLLLEDCVKRIGWVIEPQIVGFTDDNNSDGLLFLETMNIIRNLTDISFEETFYQIFRGKKVGIVTLSGKTIFEPLYSGVAIFDHNIYIAYTVKRNAILNSESWEKPIRAEVFKKYRVGILAKFCSGEYAWVNSKTGKVLKQEELTRNQINLLEMAKKKDELQQK